MAQAVVWPAVDVVPGLQAVGGDAEPAAQKKPAGHSVHVGVEAPPSEYLPAAHAAEQAATARLALSPKRPAAHGRHTAPRPPGEYRPAWHGLQNTPKMPVPAGHATVAVIVANTLPEAASVKAAPAVGVPVRKAHTVLAAVASATDGARGEVIVYGASVFAVDGIVEGVPPVVMASLMNGTTVSPMGIRVPVKVHGWEQPLL